MISSSHPRGETAIKFRYGILESTDVNWVRFALTATYGIVVFVFFFAYLAGFINTSNLANDVLYVGGLIMLGIILTMASLTSEKSP